MNFLIITKIFFVISFVRTEGVTDTLRTRLVPNKLLLHFNKSLVLSPLTLKLPLFKLTSIAQGEVKKDLLTVLGCKKDTTINTTYWNLQEPLTHLKNIDFVMFNHIYVNYSDDFKSNFFGTTYGVQVEKISFNYPDASTDFVNKRMDQISYKRLTDVLVKGDIRKNSSMLLVNGAFLKPTFEVPFDLEQTKYINFRTCNGTKVPVPMMYKTEDVMYVDDDLNRLKAINMKLASFGSYMTIVIPEDRNSFVAFLNGLLKPNFFRTIKKRMRLEKVTVAVPRFKLKTLVDWTNSLQQIGLHKIFLRNSTGLDSILKDTSKNKNIHLSKVVQKNFIEFNEMGAFRLIPSGGQDFIPYRDQTKKFSGFEATADRPFYFEVSLNYDRSDYWNSEDLLAGVYYGPY